MVIDYVGVRDEDCIVRVLTESSIKKLYRFYGARHSAVGIGHRIDFEEELGRGGSLPLLRNVMDMPYGFMFEPFKLHFWQFFLKQLNAHLRDVESVDGFYLKLCGRIARKLEVQNPKRVLLEAYMELLEFEGRLDMGEQCFLCGEALGESVSLARALLKGHPSCILGRSYEKGAVLEMFASKLTINMDDGAIESIYKIYEEGL